MFELGLLLSSLSRSAHDPSESWDESSPMSWAVSFPLIKQRKIYSPGGLEAKTGFVKHFGVKDIMKNHGNYFISYNPQLLVRETQSISRQSVLHLHIRAAKGSGE